MSRLHLCLDVAKYVPGKLDADSKLVARCKDLLAEHEIYIRTHFDDLPEIKDWIWTD
jgi:xylulose-5-phosphate/fructose-6-phosphate phosphoketolase